MFEPRRHRAGRLALAGAFARAALLYWLVVFPRVASELRHWRRSAERIADPDLRRLALASLAKRGNMEGAAAFAAFVPWRARASAIRALVAFQAIYNYADLLAEQPSEDPVGNARDVHRALLVALDPSGESSMRDFRSTAGGRVDGDFLAEMIAACETASWQLPSYGTVAAAVCEAAERIVAFQSLSLGRAGELESWAESQDLGPINTGFAWWEVAAAAGSSLAVHALLAAAALPELTAQDAATIEAAYFPCIGALHSLLDSLVDEQEDAATGQLRLIRCYPSRGQAAAGLQHLAARALFAARRLPGGADHALLVTAMACSYLAAPEASSSGADDVTRQVRASLGPLVRPMLLVFKLRRLAGGGSRVRRRRAGAAGLASGQPEPAAALSPGASPRGGDARAV
jgi:tetraprenyl-beta-curcumene synthase